METFSVLLAICAGNSPVTGELSGQRRVTWSFNVFFDLCLNKRLNKQSSGWWFETASRSLWRHCIVNRLSYLSLRDACDMAVVNYDSLNIGDRVNSLADGRRGSHFISVISTHVNGLSSKDVLVRLLSCGCHRTHPWWSVNIGSGNGLVLPDNKPLPESMLTQICVAIWRHQATVS